MVATEMGDQGLTTTADIVVNVEDLNDNHPVFQREEYRYSKENELCTIDLDLRDQIQYCTLVR